MTEEQHILVSVCVCVHSQTCIWGGFTEKATFYVCVKECIAVCEIEIGKERMCFSSHKDDEV